MPGREDLRARVSVSSLRESLFSKTRALESRGRKLLRKAQRFNNFLRVFIQTNRPAFRIHQARRDKDDEVALDFLIDIGAEKTPGQRNVTQDRDLVLNLLHIFADQSTQRHGLTIPNAYAGGHFARRKNRLIDYVRRSARRSG